MDKTLLEMHEGEVFTDNTKIEKCTQCKNCINWGNSKDDYFTNAFDKACCDKYPVGVYKPLWVINNTEGCMFREIQ